MQSDFDLLQGLFLYAPIGMMVVDGQGSIQDMNPAATEMVRVDYEQSLQMRFVDFLAESFHASGEQILAELKEVGSLQTELTLQCTHGETVDVFLQGMKLSENRYILYCIDSSRHSHKSRSRFLANISHEIRTPLNGIIGFSQLLHQTEMNDTQLEYLRIIDSSAHSLFSMINDILDASRLETGKLKSVYSPFELHGLLYHLVDLVGSDTEPRNLEIGLHIDPDVPERIVFDSSRLSQVLTNLLDNAVKFTQEGSIQIEVSANRTEPADSPRAPVQTKSCDITFSITDTGIGIPLDRQKEIFESFAQGESSLARSYGGTGLGLSISSKILQLLGSELTLESEPGKGSRFAFTIHVEVGQVDTSGTGKEGLVLSNRPYRIMIVEDIPTNMTLLARILEQLLPSVTIIPAYNGQEALNIRQNTEPDLVFMDLHMPRMDGFETTRIMRIADRDAQKRLPIIAITADTIPCENQKCSEYGMDAYLGKPLDVGEIANCLKEYLVREP